MSIIDQKLREAWAEFQKYAQQERCQEPLFAHAFLGRPRPRTVTTKCHCVTI